MELKMILGEYEKAIGQTVNLDKSAISFGKKVDERVRSEIHERLKILKESDTGSYLGLPECFSGSRVDMLSYIRDRLKSKMTGWFAKTLSLGGEEVLLKVVAMAMLIYGISCFKFPKTTCASLSSVMANFWWNSVEDRQKVH